MYVGAHLLRTSKGAHVLPRGGRQKLFLPVLQESCNFPLQLRRFDLIFSPHSHTDCDSHGRADTL